MGKLREETVSTHGAQSHDDGVDPNRPSISFYHWCKKKSDDKRWPCDLKETYLRITPVGIFLKNDAYHKEWLHAALVKKNTRINKHQICHRRLLNAIQRLISLWFVNSDSLNR